jgi:hypothetical protein
VSIEERIAEVLRRLDNETTGGDLASRSSTSPEQWAAVLATELGLTQQWLTRHESGGARIFDIEQEAREHFRGFVYRAPGVEDPGSGHLTGIESRFVTGWRDE